MNYPRYCKRHPSYQAKHVPATACAECIKAYTRERKKFAIVNRAARQLSRLLGVEVTLEASYHRKEGNRDDAGIFVSVTPTNTPEYDGTLPNPDGGRSPAGRPRKRVRRASMTVALRG